MDLEDDMKPYPRWLPFAIVAIVVAGAVYGFRMMGA